MKAPLEDLVDDGKGSVTSLDALLERCTSSFSGTWNITLPIENSADVTLHFRVADRYGELRVFERAAHEFVRRCLAKKGPPEFLVAIEGLDAWDVAAAYSVHYWSAEPTRLTQLQALRLARAPWVMKRLITEIDERQSRGMARRWMEATTRKKASS